MTARRWRPTWAEIDLGAVTANASVLAGLAAPGALCAVVKADGYGHGAVEVARAALAGGAAWLAVALVEEGVALREAGIGAPILVLSEPPPEAWEEAVRRRLVPTVYTVPAVRSLGAVVARLGTGHGIGQGDGTGLGVGGSAGRGAGTYPVHVKVDTGMHRVGADPDVVPEVVRTLRETPGLAFAGLWTHLAVADGAGPEDAEFTHAQLRSFSELHASLRRGGVDPGLVHAANSAGSIAYPQARLDLVRCGIALYGELPAPHLGRLLATATGGGSVRPVLSLRARVTLVRTLPAGARPSYGRARPLPERSLVATVPIGYADGLPRRLFECGGTVLIRGVRRPFAGVVTMDQIVVDCGPVEEHGVEVGDEVVLLGTQGGESITATEWATLLSTISYEVLCGIGPRVPRLVRPGPA
jgi:alanine racemase